MPQVINKPRKYQLGDFGLPELLLITTIVAVSIFVAWRPVAHALHNLGFA